MSVGVDIFPSDQVCGVVSRSAPIQAEVARLVMDVECVNNKKELYVGSGCERMMKAHSLEVDSGGLEKRLVEVGLDSRGIIGNSCKRGWA